MKRNFKGIILGVSFILTICSEAFCADTGLCGENCQYTFSNGTLTFSPIDSSQDAVISETTKNYGLSGTVVNAIISEGITDVKYIDGNYNILRNIGTNEGKLVIPSSMRNFGVWSSFSMKFGTVEINAANMTFNSSSFEFDSSATPTIILSPDSNITFTDNAFYEAGSRYQSFQYPASLNIACKGNPEICLSKFGNSLNNMSGNIKAEYYKGLNSDGNYEVWSKNGYEIYTNSDMKNLLERYDENGALLERYDENGNMLDGMQSQTDGSFRILKDGKVIGFKNKRIYTVDEATIVTKNNKNTFTLKYR